MVSDLEDQAEASVPDSSAAARGERPHFEQERTVKSRSKHDFEHAGTTELNAPIRRIRFGSGCRAR